MHIKIEDLEQHVTAFVESVDQSIDGPLHAAVQRFVVFVEGRVQAEADAVKLLQERGYTVTPPPQAGA
jgi:hypothetical protein